MDEYVLEQAEALARAEVDEGIRRVRAKMAVQPKDFDGLCMECGEDIPPQRLSFGAITCVECQSLLEQRAKHVRSK
jgi:RNA polymerase-binding transcription factor DksA